MYDTMYKTRCDLDNSNLQISCFLKRVVKNLYCVNICRFLIERFTVERIHPKRHLLLKNN